MAMQAATSLMIDRFLSHPEAFSQWTLDFPYPLATFAASRLGEIDRVFFLKEEER